MKVLGRRVYRFGGGTEIGVILVKMGWRRVKFDLLSPNLVNKWNLMIWIGDQFLNSELICQIWGPWKIN